MESLYFAPKTQPCAALSLGCMNFGKRTPKAESIRIIHAALEAGIGLFDTANAYNDGESERIVGEALRGREALVATKVGFGAVGGRPEGLSRARVLAACEESLRRLGVDQIDLYYLHVPDHTVPIEETLEAVRTLLDTGKIRRWGVSNYAAWQILEMRRILGMPAVSQVLYNALVRQLDVEYFKFTQRYPLHTTIYNPLAGGVLTGLHDPSARPPKGSRFHNNTRYQRRFWTPSLFQATEALRELAAEAGLPLVHLAYAFALRHPGVDSVLVGPGSLAHLGDALAARECTLTPEQLGRMDAIHRALVGTDASYAR